MIYDVDRPFYFRPVAKVFLTVFPFFNRARKDSKTCFTTGRNPCGWDSSWRVAGEKSYLWVGTTPDCTFFHINPSRSALLRFINAFLGRLFRETLTTNRYNVYNQHSGRRQSCLAHVDRSLAKNGGKGKGSMLFPGKTSQKELGKIFALWHEYKAGKFSRELIDRSKRTEYLLISNNCAQNYAPFFKKKMVQ